MPIFGRWGSGFNELIGFNFLREFVLNETIFRNHTRNPQLIVYARTPLFKTLRTIYLWKSCFHETSTACRSYLSSPRLAAHHRPTATSALGTSPTSRRRIPRRPTSSRGGRKQPTQPSRGSRPSRYCASGPSGTNYSSFLHRRNRIV